LKVQKKGEGRNRAATKRGTLWIECASGARWAPAGKRKLEKRKI